MFSEFSNQLGLGGFAGSISSVIFSALLPGLLVPIFGYTPLLIASKNGDAPTCLLNSSTISFFSALIVHLNSYSA